MYKEDPIGIWECTLDITVEISFIKVDDRLLVMNGNRLMWIDITR